MRIHFVHNLHTRVHVLHTVCNNVADRRFPLKRRPTHILCVVFECKKHSKMHICAHVCFLGNYCILHSKKHAFARHVLQHIFCYCKKGVVLTRADLWVILGVKKHQFVHICEMC